MSGPHKFRLKTSIRGNGDVPSMAMSARNIGSDNVARVVNEVLLFGITDNPKRLTVVFTNKVPFVIYNFSEAVCPAKVMLLYHFYQ